MTSQQVVRKKKAFPETHREVENLQKIALGIFEDDDFALRFGCKFLQPAR